MEALRLRTLYLQAEYDDYVLFRRVSSGVILSVFYAAPIIGTTLRGIAAIIQLLRHQTRERK